MLRPFCFFALLLATPLALASEVRVLDIQSPSDHYAVTLGASGESATVNGQAADLSTLKDFLPLLSQPLENPCPAITEPADVKIKEAGRRHEIFFKKQLVREGDNCLQVTGDGLNFFPIHRDFLIGAKQGVIRLSSPLFFKVAGQTLFQLEGKSPAWRVQNSDFLPNWDFWERFEKTLRAFTIRLRVRTSLISGDPQLVLLSGGKRYAFFKAGPTGWAIQRPEQNWLEITDDLSFLYDLDNSVFEDRFASSLRSLGDPRTDLKLRRQQFDSLRTAWNPNVREVYFKLVLDPNENADLKTDVVRRLREHPTHETALTMAKYLPLASDENKKLATQILKLVDAKGPLFTSEDPPAAQRKTLKYWATWLKKESTKP